MTTLAHDTRARARPGAVKTAFVNLRRRRSYLIDPGTQLTITRQFVIVLLAASGLSVGNYHVFRTMLAVEKQDGVDLLLAYGYCSVMLAISATLLFLLCVFFSHRIAGPARKLSEALDHMANRDLCVKVRLRDNDLLKELAEALNAANRDLRSALGEVDRETRRAMSLAGDDGELRACLQRVERALAEFHITDAAELDAREAASRGARAGSRAA